MTEFAALLQGIAGIAWPIAFVVVALLFRRFIAQLLTRENVSIKIAGMEVSVAEATRQAGNTLTDVVQRVAQLEERFGDVITEPVEPSNKHPGSSTQGTAVLWVDDFPSNNAFLIQKFEQDGIRVRKEISTDAGLAALRQESFNAIVSDLGRSENGVQNPFAGLDFVKEVRASGIRTPILIFTSRRGLEYRDRLMSAGVNEVTDSTVDVFRFVSEYRA
jgi:CheY-like chemotaxis protein